MNEDSIKIHIELDVVYTVPLHTLPKYATPNGVEKLIEEAFVDLQNTSPYSGKRGLMLKDFTKEGLLMLDPIEVTVNTVLAL